MRLYSSRGLRWKAARQRRGILDSDGLPFVEKHLKAHLAEWRDIAKGLLKLGTE